MAELTLKLDSEGVATLQGMTECVMEHGNALLCMATKRFADKLARAMIEANPELRESGREMIDQLAEAGAPEEVLDQVREIVEGPSDEPAPITEEEVAEADVESLLDRALREGKPGETS